MGLISTTSDATKIAHSLATEANDFLVASGPGVFVKKTLTETRAILGVDSGYTHNQSSPSDTWIINHNLGRYPTITLLSVGLSEFIGEIVHTSINQAIVYLAVAQAGIAQCR